MSGRGGGGGAFGNVSADVPASSRNVVQSLKEIVSCSDLEIYAMLVECDMDPDETVSRLLSQDTFHEVKSKREKKKETKAPAGVLARSIPNRGARNSGSDSYNTTRGRGNRFITSNEPGSAQATPANRREYGRRDHWVGSSSTPSVLGRQLPSNSDPHPTNAEVKKALTRGAITSSLAYQSPWVNPNPGQRTMADIVKMGRPLHQKNVDVPRSSSETQESGSKAPLRDEWPSIEKQDVSVSESQHLDDSHLDDEVPETKTNPIVSPPDTHHHVPPASVSTTNFLDDDSRVSSLYEDENNKAEQHGFEENGGGDVSASSGTDFQQLSIEDEEDKPAVTIPSHLQVHTSECSLLVFGSFGSRVGYGQAQEIVDASSFRHLDTDFYGEEEEQLRNAATGEQSYQINSTARNYHASSDFDIHYSPFLTTYNTATPSSLSSPAISIAEALRAASVSPQNAVPGAGQQAPALAQHLALNPYSHQPEVPLEHYGNMISYSFVPQSYNTYMPSAFQQAFPSGNHQSVAAMLPQYNTQVTASHVPPPSAYGFGGGGGAVSSNNFSMNPTNAPNSYGDVLFKESNHLASLLKLQNENSAVWHQEQQPNSCVVPGSGYYSFPGHQNDQQLPGFGQTQQLQQQPSSSHQQQHFGEHDYVSPYHSQATRPIDHPHHQHQQQQYARDASQQSQKQLQPNN